jgi:type II secretion system (T2SS) protein M
MAGIREQIQRLALRLIKRTGAFFEPYLARLRPYVRPYTARLSARYDRLEQREKILVQALGVLVFAFLAYNLVYSPFQGLRQDLSDRIEARQRETLEVRRLVHEHQQLQLEVAAAEKRTVRQGKDFSLFSALEGMLSSTVGVTKVASITPGEDKVISKDLVQHNVDIMLTGVNLTEIVDTLYGINSLPVPVFVSDLHIKRSQIVIVNVIFDVDLTCVAIGRSG